MLTARISATGLSPSILILPLIVTLAPQIAGAANPIQTENARAGTTAWQLTNPATAREIGW